MTTQTNTSKVGDWIDAIDITEDTSLTHEELETRILTDLCNVFSEFPFMVHNNLKIQMGEATPNLMCKTPMAKELVGNVTYGILHGGVTATILDSIGVVQVMANLISQGLKNGEQMSELLKKLTRVATIDLRIDYLKPGRGETFTATAEVMRLGKKSSTTRMQMVNEKGVIIAIATASFVY